MSDGLVSLPVHEVRLRMSKEVQESLDSRAVLTKWCVGFSALIVLAGLLIGGVRLVEQSSTFRIQRIEVHGALHHTAKEELQADLLKRLQPGFFALDLGGIRAALLAFPWIAEVHLKRQWPDALIIQIVEQQPLARWGNEGIMNPSGELFYPKDLNHLEDLPTFYGREEEAPSMRDAYFEFERTLKPLGLGIRVLECMPDRSLRMILSNGMGLILGQKEVADRMKRFAFAYRTKLKDQISNVAYVDLRYTNGVAIGWKSRARSN